MSAGQQEGPSDELSQNFLSHLLAHLLQGETGLGPTLDPRQLDREWEGVPLGQQWQSRLRRPPCCPPPLCLGAWIPGQTPSLCISPARPERGSLISSIHLCTSCPAPRIGCPPGESPPWTCWGS